ncbi:serine/threonine protein kinase [Ktedonobacter racemifer]|uniref:Serine/threonine protein kinase n=1 Tax=Ktedonobacter racemifer DSM 44963 TaxID=485913 RepID=D6U8L1_KTERA|nr:serine/threonine protein kinase [Ktedonobacter racemifer]EFH80222.1 serine/threonine protein kinase [Ktedonobacter racemifer DSM 44963]
MAELFSAGPSSFATDGERQAAALLQQQLPANWTIICNKIFSTRNGNSNEMDFIIIAQNWIFLLDEKSWKGRIRGDDEQWIRANGSSERSPLGKIDYIAKVFAGDLGYRLPVLKRGGHYVRGGVLLSKQETYPQIHDPRAAQGVFLLADVAQRLKKLDSQGGNPAVGQHRAKIKEELLHFANRPQVPQSIHFFKIDDAISLRPNVRLFNATMEDEPSETRHLLVYDLGKDPLKTDELSDFYKQEYRAIKKLHTTGLVPDVQDPFIWSEDYLVVPFTPPSGKALKALALPETREEFGQELQLAAACFKGLDQIHSQGIIHRALGPETIYVQSKHPPKVMFTNFYAARVGTNTIAPSLDTLSFEDPYASVDVAIGYEYASVQTDTFSLALILLERLSGISISKLRPGAESKLLLPDQPRWSSFLSAELSNELIAILRRVVEPENGAAPLSAKDAGNRLSSLAQRLRDEDRKVEESLLCKRYKVQQVLGQGMMARTYKVSDTEYENLGSYVLKQFLRPEEVIKQAVAEYKALKDIASKYLPRIDYIFPPGEDAHILMQYIPGPTLQQVEIEFPWPLERWWSFAQDLLNAIEVLEQKMLLHRDIKPANIILHEEDNHPVLIDFGFAMQLGAEEKIAGTPLYLPPETISTRQTPISADRYAAAIVLFQALIGSLPFTIVDGGKRNMLDLEQIEDTKVRRIAAVLQRALSIEPAERPANVNQMRNELQTAFLAIEEPIGTQELKDEINTWVDNIRSLYRNSDIGNTNNRGLDSDFVRETYIQTALDRNLLPALFAQHPRILFLSGNPGDGKTAFLEQVYLELKRLEATVVKHDPSGWEIVYQGHTFRSCYDASESHEQLSADEQLSEKLQGLEGQHPSHPNLTVLVAINDGRLFDFFQRQRTRFPWLAQKIDELADVEIIEEHDVWLVDMKKRAFVSIDAHEASIFKQILDRFTEPEHWAICEGCAAQTVCPIRNNSQALRQKRVKSRLEFLFLLIHLRRQRHITMRDLRSAIAYLITGNQSCQDIHEMRNGSDGSTSLMNLSYWQNTFAPADTSDDLLNDIANLDPARFARPHLDRFLHFHQLESDATQRRQLFINKQDLPPQRFKDAVDWIAAFKRRLYFEVAKLEPESGLPIVNPRQLLPYRYATKFLQLQDDRLDADVALERLALGLLRSDGVFEDVPPGKMSIKVSASDEQQLVVLKQLPLEDFTLSVLYPQNTELIETLPEIVVLEHFSGTPRMEITLDTFELLAQMADGLQPDAREYAPLLADLKPFKDALLLRETQELILIESQFRVHHVAQRDGKIVRQLIQG